MGIGIILPYSTTVLTSRILRLDHDQSIPKTKKLLSWYEMSWDAIQHDVELTTGMYT
jgi:hypothetical protein